VIDPSAYLNNLIFFILSDKKRFILKRKYISSDRKIFYCEFNKVNIENKQAKQLHL